MAKKLGNTKINNDVKKYSVIKRVNIDEDTYLDIYPNFKPTEIKEVIDEFIHLNTVADKNNIKIKEKILPYFLEAVTINHFSKLDLSSKDEIKYINTLLNLIDLDNDGFNTIVKEYPPENWLTLQTKYFERTKELIDTAEQVKKLQDDGLFPFNVISDDNSKVDTDAIIDEATEKVKAEENA